MLARTTKPFPQLPRLTRSKSPLRLALAMMLMGLVSGCGTVTSKLVCPALVPYSATTEATAAPTSAATTAPAAPSSTAAAVRGATERATSSATPAATLLPLFA